VLRVYPQPGVSTLRSSLQPFALDLWDKSFHDTFEPQHAAPVMRDLRA
jgi:hypothetical protein